MYFFFKSSSRGRLPLKHPMHFDKCYSNQTLSNLMESFQSKDDFYESSVRFYYLVIVFMSLRF
jgi:hypothetical protein